MDATEMRELAFRRDAISKETRKIDDRAGTIHDHVGEWCASTPFCSSRGHLTVVSLFSSLFPLPRTRLSYFKFFPASSCLYTSPPTPSRESKRTVGNWDRFAHGSVRPGYQKNLTIPSYVRARSSFSCFRLTCPPFSVSLPLWNVGRKFSRKRRFDDR